jgi:hypothetical protein
MNLVRNPNNHNPNKPESQQRHFAGLKTITEFTENRTDFLENDNKPDEIKQIKFDVQIFFV